MLLKQQTCPFLNFHLSKFRKLASHIYEAGNMGFEIQVLITLLVVLMIKQQNTDELSRESLTETGVTSISIRATAASTFSYVSADTRTYNSSKALLASFPSEEVISTWTLKRKEEGKATSFHKCYYCSRSTFAMEDNKLDNEKCKDTANMKRRH